MISLITISCIAAAFAPVVSKRLQSDTIRAGSTSKLESNCSEQFGEDCKFCGDKCCYICDSDSACAIDEFKSVCKCACVKCNASKADGGYGEGCVECSNSGCTKCQDGNNGYYLKEDKTCAKCTQAGKTYSDGKVCVASCEVTLTAGYTCVGGKKYSCRDRYNASCTTCNSSQCLTCANYTIMKNGTCVGCGMGYCYSCNAAGQCTGCQSDSVMNMNDSLHRCVYCASVISNCSNCSGSTLQAPVCKGCYTGYYLSGNSCVSCTNKTNCLSCSSDGKCITCKSGYYSDNGGVCQACSVSNCARCDSSGKCASCNQGYHLEGNQCKDNNLFFHCSDDNFIQIPYNGKMLCVTRKNMGDANSLPIPSSVHVVDIGSYCYPESQLCCWKGTTASSCDSLNGSYSGCNRTVCMKNAGEEICKNFNFAGRKWHLLSPSEGSTVTDAKFNIALGNNGTMICDHYGLSLMTKCSYKQPGCYGACKDTAACYHRCQPAGVVTTGWSITSSAGSIRCATEWEE